MKSRAFFKTGVLLLLSSLAGLFSALPAAAAPSVAWGTYMGGESTEDAYGVAVDSQGNVYVVGSTTTSAAPWVGGGWDAAYGGGADGWLVKLTPAGAHVWSTYLGGDDADYAMDVAVDGADNLYVFGFSSSAGWVADGLDTSFNGQSDAFVVRLTSAGAHVWSTYLGGAGSESGLGGALDPSGNILIVGDTTSTGMGTGGDTVFEGASEGYAVKLTPACALVWSTYVGGTGSDRCRDIAVDGAGNVFLAGDTSSDGWATGDGDTTLGDGTDAFAARLTPEGSLVWASYLGGTSEENGYSVALAPDGGLRVAGLTLSEGWTAGGWSTTYAGSADGFAARLSADGVCAWSTYLGGTALRSPPVSPWMSLETGMWSATPCRRDGSPAAGTRSWTGRATPLP